jgi:hypothetical protein
MNISKTRLVRSLILGLVVLPGTSVVSAQTTIATTEILGFCSVTLPPGGRVLAPVFVKSSVYDSQETVYGNSFSATNLTDGSFSQVSVNGATYPSYYVEITDTNTFQGASYQGRSFDVVSNSPSSITVSGIPVALNGQKIAIRVRPHVTLGECAAASSGLVNDSDTFTLYESGNTTTSYIYDQQGVVAGDYTTSCNGIPVPPCNAMVVNNLGSASVLFTGVVKTTPTVVILNTGVRLLAPLDPQGGQNLATLNLAPALQAYSAALSFVSSGGDFAVTSFYSDGSSLLDMDYNPMTSLNAPNLSLGNGFLMNSTAPGVWTNLPVAGN